MELSKNLRKTLYLGLSAMMVASLGAGISNVNANASHVHHARTHRVYKQHYIRLGSALKFGAEANNIYNKASGPTTERISVAARAFEDAKENDANPQYFAKMPWLYKNIFIAERIVKAGHANSTHSYVTKKQLYRANHITKKQAHSAWSDMKHDLWKNYHSFANRVRADNHNYHKITKHGHKANKVLRILIKSENKELKVEHHTLVKLYF